MKAKERMKEEKKNRKNIFNWLKGMILLMLSEVYTIFLLFKAQFYANGKKN